MMRGALGLPVGPRMGRMRNLGYALCQNRPGVVSNGDQHGGDLVWTILTMQTIVTSTIEGLRLEGNGIVLPIGWYRFRIKTHNMNGNVNGQRIRDYTSGRTLAIGSSGYCEYGGNGAYTQFNTIGRSAKVWIPRPTVCALEQKKGASMGSGWTAGIAGSGAANPSNRWNEVSIWRVG